MTPVSPSDSSGEDLLVALGNRDIVARSWAPDGEGVLPDGLVGGDGAHESVSVRYYNRYVPEAQITAHFYVVDARDRYSDDEAHQDLPFFVEEMVEFYLADRPLPDDSNVEDWSDHEYDTKDRMYATLAEAEAARDRMAAADDPSVYLWDGTSNRQPPFLDRWYAHAVASAS